MVIASIDKEKDLSLCFSKKWSWWGKITPLFVNMQYQYVVVLLASLCCKKSDRKHTVFSTTTSRLSELPFSNLSLSLSLSLSPPPHCLPYRWCFGFLVESQERVQ